jgi:capsular exopolysaccharide synthesis family protein
MTAPTSSPTATEPGLRDHFGVLTRRKGTIALAVALAVGAALVVSLLQTPRYSSSAVVQVPTSALARGLDGQGELAPERVIRNEVDFVGSDVVNQAVSEVLGDGASISVGSSEEVDSLVFTATSTDPDEAAEVANAYADTYIEARSQATVDAYAASAAAVQQQIDAVDEQVAGLEQSISAIEAQAQATLDPAAQATLAAQAQARRTAVQPALDRFTAQRVQLQASLDDLQLSGDVTDGVTPTVITRAEPASEPYEPAIARNLVVAFGLGLLLGVGLAFLREQLDDTVTSRAELEAATGGLPVLALVPRSGDGHAPETVPLATDEGVGSPAAEAYRALRTSVRFLDVERPLTTILVTSPEEGDGKTTTVAHLALAISRAGQRVFVVCGDLRKPQLHRHLGVDASPGLTSVLLGEVELVEALQKVPGEQDLAVLAAGEEPPNPSELLSTEAAADVIWSLAERADVVIIDSPPVLPVADALVLAQQVDGVILVADARRTGLPEIREACQRLEQVHAPMVGTVLNSAEPTATSTYGYSDEGNTSRSKWWEFWR